MTARVTEQATGSLSTTTSYQNIGSAISSDGEYYLLWDNTNLADGEELAFRAQYQVTSGGSAIASQEVYFTNAQTNKVFIWGPFPSLYSLTFQVKRTGGSASSHDYTILETVDDVDPAEAGDQMDLVANAVDSTSIASAAITSAKFAASAITANVLAANCIGSSELATSAAQEIRDEILSDGTPFAGANIDAAISSRAAAGDSMALTAAAIDAIWEEATGASRPAGSFGQAVIDILEDVATTIPATLSTIDGKIDTIDTEVGDIQTDVTQILSDIAALPSATDIGAQVWNELTSARTVAGSFGLALGTTIQATLATIDTEIGDIQTDTTAILAALVVIDDEIATIDANVDTILSRVDVAVSTRAAPGDAMDLVANAVDAAAVATGAIDADAIAADAITAAKIATDAIGSDELATSAVNKIVDQAWIEQIGDHDGTVGSTAEALQAAAGGGGGGGGSFTASDRVTLNKILGLDEKIRRMVRVSLEQLGRKDARE